MKWTQRTPKLRITISGLLKVLLNMEFELIALWRSGDRLNHYIDCIIQNRYLYYTYSNTPLVKTLNIFINLMLRLLCLPLNPLQGVGIRNIPP